MATQIPAGPFQRFKTREGFGVPFYLIPFDKDGICIGPETRTALIKEARAGNFTDVILFSHGWNNDFHFAVTHYQEFINGYTELRKNLDYKREVRPLLIGVIWPSTALVLESERPPDFAAGAGEPAVAVAAEGFQVIQELSAAIPAGKRERFCKLAQRTSLNATESLDLADLLLPVFQSEDDELKGKRPAAAQELLDLLLAGAKQLGGPGNTGEFGFADDAPAAPASNGPAAAGFLADALSSVRDSLRLATVWQMKDRAGVVGSKGVGPLLDDLLKESNARVHLVGHSYGGKVCLSALCFKPKSRPVDSVLLLQPAVSGLCFTDKVPGENRPGGYFPALDGRLKQPILTTFSANDFPLTKVFHLALRRNSDLGEAAIAGAAPSVYAALGGFGPQGSAAEEIKIKTPTDRYDLGAAAPRIYGLEGTAEIPSHGGVSSAATWWALFNQLDQA